MESSGGVQISFSPVGPWGTGVAGGSPVIPDILVVVFGDEAVVEVVEKQRE